MLVLPDPIQELKSNLTKPLPGWKSWEKITSQRYKQYMEAPEKHYKASVLALLFYQEGELMICYMKRTSHHKADKHKGQISFPGGKKEEGESLLDCVKREIKEEIGIDSQSYQLIGNLSTLYVYVSNFLVYPYVGYSHTVPKFVADPPEVEELIIWPVSELNKGTKTKDIKVREMLMKEVPYYPLKEEVLWGATAMMTTELLDVMRY